MAKIKSELELFLLYCTLFKSYSIFNFWFELRKLFKLKKLRRYYE